MKKIYFLLSTTVISLFALGQASTANYTFSTNTSSSLTDMSTGTTTLIGADQDDIASAITAIGFNFYLNGTGYNQFSVNSNGTLRLGSTAVGNTAYEPLAQAGQALITSYGSDQRSHLTGKVHFKVTGAAPNRVLVVEWLNMQSDFNAGGVAGLTYQLLLYETTGIIESIYGAMTQSAAGAADANSNSPQYGFSTNNTAGNVGTVTAAQSGTPAPTYNGAGATVVNNACTAGTISVLSSAANGSRRMFRYVPPVPAAPTSLTFTGVSTTTTTLNWTDVATNEAGYIISRSTDAVNYTVVAQVAANSTSSVQSNLEGPVLYHWKVNAVTEGALSADLTGSQATLAPGVITSNGTGLWDNPLTWSPATVPGVNDAVTIRNADVVTINTAALAYNITVGQGASGILEFEATTARTLTVSTNVTIVSGGTFRSNTAGTQTGHVLSLNGNLTNNGTLDFSTNAETAGAGITFTGATNNSFTGTGNTDIRQITINKGTASTNILELATSNFTVRGSIIDDVVGGFLVLTNGTFKISGTNTYTGRMFGAAAYTIPASSGVWLNNPNFTIAAQNGNAVNNGILRISAGTWNIGTTAAATVTGAAFANFRIEGGIINIAGRFNPNTAVAYAQTGGTVNLATVGNSGSGTANATFTLAATATFNFSGGNINIVQASTGATPIDWFSSPVPQSFGGTLTFGTAATATNFNFRMRGNLPNFVVDNTTNAKTLTATAQVNLNGSSTISTGSTMVINGQICLVIGTPFTNNGTLTGTAGGTRFYFLGGSGPATYTGTGVVTSPLTAFEVDNAAGVTINPSVNQIILTRYNNFAGGVTNANKLTIGSGAVTAATIQLGVTGATNTVTGFDVPPVFNPGTGGINLLYAPELTGRTTGNEMPPSRTLALLSISNPNPITITGGDVLTSSLTMSAGNIITGSNTLTLGTAAATPGTYTYTAGIIVGKFKRWVNAVAGNTDFPVGIATAKRNVSINFTAAPTTGGTLTSEWIPSYAGITGLPLTEGAQTINSVYNDGYWSVVAGDGITGGTYTGTFTATAVTGITDLSKLVLIKRANNAAPWTLDGTHVTASGTLTAPVLSRTGMTGFSEFAIGADNFAVLPVNLLSLNGRRTGANNQLYWATASELNNRGFQIERSYDGRLFNSIGFVASKAVNGSSNTQINYDYTDMQADAKMAYYRLRQLDIDGRSSFSNMVTIKLTQTTTLSVVSIYPNPSVTNINVQVSSRVKEKMTLLITDISGKKLISQPVMVETGTSNIQVNVSKLAAGSYLVQLHSSQDDSMSPAQVFIKQ